MFSKTDIKCICW